LAATLLDLHGVQLPEEVEGLPIGRAPADRARFQFSVARQGVLQAVIQGDHKLHYAWDDGALQLYDRRADPGEANDLSETEPDRVAELWSLLAPEVEALDPLLDDSPVLPE
jgi:arylsulfatase A-like enzyme